LNCEAQAAKEVVLSIPDWPKFPHIQVDVRDLTDESEPWELINRCVFASKRAGLSVIEIMRFTNHILYFCPTYADAFVHCLLTFDCESAVTSGKEMKKGPTPKWRPCPY
jgi:hypothetical protein